MGAVKVFPETGTLAWAIVHVCLLGYVKNCHGFAVAGLQEKRRKTTKTKENAAPFLVGIEELNSLFPHYNHIPVYINFFKRTQHNYCLRHISLRTIYSLDMQKSLEETRNKPASEGHQQTN